MPCSYSENVMKTCKRCQEQLDITKFVRDSSRPGGYKPYCKPCYSAMRRDYVNKNKDKIRTYQDAYNKRYRTGKVEPKEFNPNGSYDYKRDYLDTIKREAGCFYCNENEPCCLSFHHRNPSQKVFGVANFIGRTIEELDTEIAKCAVLCENCHRKVHAGLLPSFSL